MAAGQRSNVEVNFYFRTFIDLEGKTRRKL